MKKVDLDESELNREITSNTTFRLYFLKKIVLAHFQNLFGKSSCECSEKMKAKCMNEDVRKSCFC